MGCEFVAVKSSVILMFVSSYLLSKNYNNMSSFIVEKKTTFVCNDSSISLLSHLFHLTISKKNPSSSRTCQSQVANQKCTGVYVGFHLRTPTSSFYLVCSYVVVVPWKLNTTEKRLHSWTCKTISILFFLCICAEIIGSQERKLKGVMHGTICFQYSRA